MDFQIIDSNTLIGTHPTHRLDLSAERLLRDMDKYRINASLALSTIGVFCDYRRGNIETMETAKANQRLVPVATINPTRYFGKADEIQGLRTQGFRIIKFYPDSQSWAPDSAAFLEVLRQLAPVKMPVMITCESPGVPSLIARQVANYPAPVILSGVNGEMLSEMLPVAALPNIMLETHELHVPGALSMLAERIGPERIIFGSGAPRRSNASSLYYVMYSELSDEQKQLVLGGNIKRILEAG